MSAEVQSPIDLTQLDAVLNRLLKFTEDSWGKATAYDTAIIVAGYGAFFALWSGVSNDVTPAARDVAAALIGISVLLYIAWHIILMLARHWHDRAFVEVAISRKPPDEILREWELVEAKQRAALLRIQGRMWKPIFGTSVITGVIGAGVLIYNCIAAATDLPQLVG